MTGGKFDHIKVLHSGPSNNRSSENLLDLRDSFCDTHEPECF